jgi:hypothetical protein
VHTCSVQIVLELVNRPAVALPLVLFQCPQLVSPVQVPSAFVLDQTSPP